MEINHHHMMDTLPSLTTMKDIWTNVETLKIIVLIFKEIIDILPKIHEVIMIEMIQDILPMIIEIIMTEMIQDILLMIHETILTETIREIPPMIHEMILEVWIFEEFPQIKEIVGKVVEILIIFKTIGKIKVVEVLEAIRTSMFSFNKIIHETHLINFRREKGFLRKNLNNY